MIILKERELKKKGGPARCVGSWNSASGQLLVVSPLNTGTFHGP